MSFRMNSPQGKAILALVRSGDYAHPGEEEAIRKVAADLPRENVRRVLDVGCGRGGTAHWFQTHRWGEVVGVDIDNESIGYGQRTYPDVQFHACDVGHISELSLPLFDLAYLFNSFYAFPDQQHALGELRRVCRDGAHLMIFDYTRPAGADIPVALRNEIGHPIVIETLRAWMASNRWQPVAVSDVTADFVAWYDVLVHKIQEQERLILDLAGRDWYHYVLSWYSALLDALMQRSLGGAVIYATATRAQQSEA